MVLPIYAYGHGVLKKKGENISPDYPDLPQLIENMWETMENANGVGLAAPQVGLSIRMFVIDTFDMMEENHREEGMRKVFINAQKLEEGGEVSAYEEGCLSIPEIRGDVERPAQLRLRYLDEQFVEHEEVFTGINARVIQHEYDHIDGVLFVEHLKPLKKRLIKRKLDNIKKGDFKSTYKMKFISIKK
ncbi:MAG: peptide deformylase [Saprospiraceae bacterium]|nr:peptide deformylase [Saprospiraceae bacterium]